MTSDPGRSLLGRFTAASAEFRALSDGYRAHVPGRREVDLPEAVYRLRARVIGMQGEVWRSIEIRPEAPLAKLHDVLQEVFDWDDVDIFHFAVPDEGEGWQCLFTPLPTGEGDEIWTPLQEALWTPGDTIYYRYRYRTTAPIEVLIGLDEIRPTGEDPPLAVCLGGRGMAPEEDDNDLGCGAGAPSVFDLDEVNVRLRSLSAAYAAVIALSAFDEDVRYYLAWTPEAYADLLARWPGLADDYDVPHGEYVEEVASGMFEEWLRGHAPVVASGTVDTYAAHCEERRIDPASPSSLYSYGAHRAVHSPVVYYPPALTDDCWCGSGTAYADCCLPGA